VVNAGSSSLKLRVLDAADMVTASADLSKVGDGMTIHSGMAGRRTVLAVQSVGEPAPDDRYDLVLVPVRSEQLAGTLPVLTAMNDGPDVLFFGNTAGHQAELLASLRQQKTTLGELNGAMTPRVRHLQDELSGAGFPATVSASIDDWLLGHAAFVAPIAFALYRVDTDPAKLAADPRTLRLMVLAIRQAFAALRAAGNTEIPTNLRVLFLRLPTAFAVAYWRRVFAGPRGELWFAAHTRAAPDEMRSLAQELQKALRRTGHPTPDLDKLLMPGIPSLAPAQAAAGNPGGGDPDGLLPRAAWPGLDTRRQDRRPLGFGGHVVCRAMDEDAPTFAGRFVDVVDLERDLVLGVGYPGLEILSRGAVLRGAEHDGAVVQHVVDGEDRETVPAQVRKPADAARRDQPEALRLIQRLQGVVRIARSSRHCDSFHPGTGLLRLGSAGRGRAHLAPPGWRRASTGCPAGTMREYWSGWTIAMWPPCSHLTM
jgi:2-dehydropantoate 2-reductase